MPTTVINIRDPEAAASFYVYIGRTARVKLHYGNPFGFRNRGIPGMVILESREAAVGAFGRWLRGEAWAAVDQDRRRWILETIHTLRNKTLGCFCKPQDCHGDILAQMADAHA